jgi:ankyrin repeat protein
MYAVNKAGLTPYDVSCRSEQMADHLLAIYDTKLTQDHGRLALHELLKVAEYSFVRKRGYQFHPPLHPLRIILPLGKLTLTQLRTLLRTLEPELIRTRDDTGKLPIHIACQTNAPVEVLALILELDPTTLHIADYTGALPIHLLCGTLSATEYASVRYLVEQGGVGTLAARNRRGLLPLHVLCRSTNPPLRAVQYLIQSFPGSVAVQTNAGQYPFMMAAAENPASASLSVIYELFRANPGLLVPR